MKKQKHQHQHQRQKLQELEAARESYRREIGNKLGTLLVCTAPRCPISGSVKPVSSLSLRKNYPKLFLILAIYSSCLPTRRDAAHNHFDTIRFINDSNSTSTSRHRGSNIQIPSLEISPVRYRGNFSNSDLDLNPAGTLRVGEFHGPRTRPPRRRSEVELCR